MHMCACMRVFIPYVSADNCSLIALSTNILVIIPTETGRLSDDSKCLCFKFLNYLTTCHNCFIGTCKYAYVHTHIHVHMFVCLI